jgi:hypothetical protein
MWTCREWLVVEVWLPAGGAGAEVEERLNEDRDCHRRIAQQMTVSVAVGGTLM